MSADGMVYALKYGTSTIKIVTSAELVTKFAEALVSFLEDQIQFSWPQSESSFNNNNSSMLNNQAYISACTNQGQQGLKYLLSRDRTQFLRVMTSKFAVEHAPNLVVEFLESKLDLQDCNPLPNNKVYGIFYFKLAFTLYIHFTF